MPHEFEILTDLVKETRDDVKDMKEVQMRQESDIRRNADSLIEHMRRTDLLEESVEIQKKRLDEIEVPNKLIKLLIDWISKVGIGAGAAYGVIRILEYFKD